MSHLVIKEVTRRFGDVVALNRLNLTLEGGITALVGPNGAGKSTFMKLATGHIRPSVGEVSAFGEPVWDNPQVMNRIGFVPEQDAFYDRLTGIEFVTLLARLQGMQRSEARVRAEEELMALGLREGLHRPISTYSKGMRQRVKLAQALVHEPDLLFLDEPLLGCDPVARRRIQDRVLELARGGCTVLISSHILPEVERMTRNIAVLSAGRLVARGHAGQVRDALSQIPSHIRIQTRAPRRVATAVSAWENVRGVRVEAESVDVETTQMRSFLEQVQGAVRADWKVVGVETMDADLDSLLSYLAGDAA